MGIGNVSPRDKEKDIIRNKISAPINSLLEAANFHVDQLPNLEKKLELIEKIKDIAAEARSQLAIAYVELTSAKKIPRK